MQFDAITEDRKLIEDPDKLLNEQLDPNQLVLKMKTAETILIKVVDSSTQ